MLLERIDKEPADVTRIVVDMSWWLDQNEIITEIVSQEVIQGMAGWSEAPYPPRDSPPPYDPTPLLLFSATLDEFSRQLITFVEFGTSGVAYTLRFVLAGTPPRQVTIELGVQVKGVPPEEPLPVPVPIPPSPASQGALALSITGGTMQGPLYLFQNPKYPTEAVTKHYVDGMTWVSGPYMPEAGGTFTGPVVMTDTLTLQAHDPVDPLQAASKQYVDGRVATILAPYVPIAGATMTGLLTLSGDPVGGLDASTKQYSDTKLALAGGTITGPLTISGNLTVANVFTAQGVVQLGMSGNTATIIVGAAANTTLALLSFQAVGTKQINFQQGSTNRWRFQVGEPRPGPATQGRT